MKKPILIAAGLAAALSLGVAAAVAREAGARHEMRFEQFDADGDGQISRVEMQARIQEHMLEADSDRDGFLSRAEIEASAQKRASDRAARMIERLDADKDGRLSPEEIASGPRAGRGFERLDADGDGAISKKEFEEMHARMGAWRHGRHDGH